MWLLVVNRQSGRGKVSKKLNHFEDLCRQQGIKYAIIDEDTADKTDKNLRSKFLSESVDAVVAFGGDGLVSVCLQSLGNTGIGFSVVPTGTGNDFARSIGSAKKSVNQIFNSIFNSDPVTLDLGLVEGKNTSRYFIQVLSVGFDASVNELANNMRWPKGKIKYTLAMLRLLPRVQNLEFSIECNGGLQQIESMLIAIANGSTYGGGMKILPNASFNDGLLDLLFVDPVSKFTLLSIFPRVFIGNHVNHRAVHILTSENFTLHGAAKSYADGEYVDELPLKISVIKDGLKTWICK